MPQRIWASFLEHIRLRLNRISTESAVMTERTEHLAEWMKAIQDILEQVQTRVEVRVTEAHLLGSTVDPAHCRLDRRASSPQRGRTVRGLGNADSGGLIFRQRISTRFIGSP